MSSNIDDVVIITVTKQSSVITRVGFGTTLWIGQVDILIQPERFKLYGDVQEMLDAGFVATDNAVKWASVHLANDTDPAKFAIGRRVPGLRNTHTVEITAPAVGVWTLTIDSVAATYTAGAGDDNDSIATGLAAAANLLIENEQLSTAVSVAIATLPIINVEGTIGGEGHTVVSLPAGAGTSTDTDTQTETAPEDWATAFTAINTAVTTKQWYFLNIEDRDDTTIGTAAGTVVTFEKIGIFQTASSDVADGTTPNVIDTIRDLGNKRAMIFWKSSDLHYADAGMSAIAAAADLDAAGGQITWNLKPLAQVPTDSLTASEKTNIELSGGSYYIDFGSGGRTQTRSAEGEFMRVQTTIDWTKARVQEDVFGGLSNTATKIDLDTTGIGTVEGLVKGRLDIGVINGHFTGDFNPTVSSPNPEDIEENDKNAGILRNVKGVAKLAQAIRQVFIQIDLTV